MCLFVWCNTESYERNQMTAVGIVKLWVVDDSCWHCQVTGYRWCVLIFRVDKPGSWKTRFRPDSCVIYCCQRCSCTLRCLHCHSCAVCYQHCQSCALRYLHCRSCAVRSAVRMLYVVPFLCCLHCPSCVVYIAVPALYVVPFLCCLHCRSCAVCSAVPVLFTLPFLRCM